MISNYGRICSLHKQSGVWYENELTQDASHYISTKINGKPRFLHVLVAEYFIGPKPAGKILDHKDEDKRNNACHNIHYVTPKLNSEFAMAEEYIAYDKETNEEVGRGSCGVLAEKLGISCAMVNKVSRKKKRSLKYFIEKTGLKLSETENYKRIRFNN